MPPTRIALIAIAALFTACGSPTEKTPNAMSSNVNPNSSPNFNPNAAPNSNDGMDVERRLWTAICNAAFNCPNVRPELLQVAGRFPNAQTCIANGDLPGLDLDDGQLQASIAAGRARWDSAKADQCFEELRAELCAGGDFESLTSCEAVVVGLVAEGGACASGEECETGLDCATDGDTCAGVCEPDCGEERCETGEICNYVALTCGPPGSVGAECDWSPDCEDGLFCDSTGVCATGGTVSAGGACSNRRECTDGLSCYSERCGTIELLDAGAACSVGEEIAALCKAGTVCTNLQIDGAQATGTCAAAQSEGGTCRVSFECAWGLACSAPTPLEIGECVPTLAAGGTCSDDAQCQSFRCSDGKCAAAETEEICEL